MGTHINGLLADSNYWFFQYTKNQEFKNFFFINKPYSACEGFSDVLIPNSATRLIFDPNTDQTDYELKYNIGDSSIINNYSLRMLMCSAPCQFMYQTIDGASTLNINTILLDTLLDLRLGNNPSMPTILYSSLIEPIDKVLYMYLEFFINGDTTNYMIEDYISLSPDSYTHMLLTVLSNEIYKQYALNPISIIK